MRVPELKGGDVLVSIAVVSLVFGGTCSSVNAVPIPVFCHLTICHNLAAVLSRVCVCALLGAGSALGLRNETFGFSLFVYFLNMAMRGEYFCPTQNVSFA